MMDADVQVVKRGRGRPRKNPLPATNGHSHEQPIIEPTPATPWGEIIVMPEEAAPPRPNIVMQYQHLAAELRQKLVYMNPLLTAVVEFKGPDRVLEAQDAAKVVLTLIQFDHGHGCIDVWTSRAPFSETVKLCVKRTDYWDIGKAR